MRARALRVLCWTAIAGCGLTVGLRAALSGVPAPQPPATEEQRRSIFYEIASKENEDRMEGELSFPGDAWSADDDFHGKELDRARASARKNQLALQEVLRALDDGLRERWPLPPSVRPLASVPPCRPRPVY